MGNTQHALGTVLGVWVRIGTKMLLFKKSELDEWMLQYREGGNAELDDLVSSTLAKVI